MSLKRGSRTSLKRFLLRYFPPGIIIEYVDEYGELQTQTIDLLDLTAYSNPDLLADSILKAIPLVPSSKRPQILKMLISLPSSFYFTLSLFYQELVDRQKEGLIFTHYDLSLKLKPHLFPVTNGGFNKAGSLLVTGSHDRTAKVISTLTGRVQFTLSGHDNVVFVAMFNNPFRDKILTGSLDRTFRVWDVSDGSLLRTYVCPSEVLCISPHTKNPHLVAVGCNTGECIIWDIVDNKEIASLTVCAFLSPNPNHHRFFFLLCYNYCCYSFCCTLLHRGTLDHSLVLFSIQLMIKFSLGVQIRLFDYGIIIKCCMPSVIPSFLLTFHNS